MSEQYEAPQSLPDINSFHFDYLNREEAMALLASTRHISCTSCPSFYAGCPGNYSPMELNTMALNDYLFKHKDGTENYLCGKLRTIINMSESELMRFRAQFETNMQRRLSAFIKEGTRVAVLNGEDLAKDEKVQRVLLAQQEQFNGLFNAYQARMDLLVRRLTNEVDQYKASNKLKDSEISYLKTVLHTNGLHPGDIGVAPLGAE